MLRISDPKEAELDSSEAPLVEAGGVIVLRLYDVAYAMDLALVERLASERDGSSATRVRLTRVEPKAIAYSEGNGQGAWAELMERMRRVIDPALDRPAASGFEEDYHVTTVQRFDREMTGEALLERVDIAALLAGDSKPLSAQSRNELLRHVFTYYRDDLVALSWDHAFVWDPAGESDSPASRAPSTAVLPRSRRSWSASTMR